MKQLLSEDDYKRAAASLAVQIKDIKTITKVEAPKGGFDTEDRPTILFERHKFYKYANGAGYPEHLDISNPLAGGYTYSNASEHSRLEKASNIDREAALKSASWGKFQIMGFNYLAAGFTALQDFINAMYAGEPEQLDAFVRFLKTDRHGRMVAALREHRWYDLAEDYNGPGNADAYAKKLKAAYDSII